eukprot:3253050-Pyramimonas_sp.AAC.1
MGLYGAIYGHIGGAFAALRAVGERSSGLSAGKSKWQRDPTTHQQQYGTETSLSCMGPLRRLLRGVRGRFGNLVACQWAMLGVFQRA